MNLTGFGWSRCREKHRSIAKKCCENVGNCIKIHHGWTSTNREPGHNSDCEPWLQAFRMIFWAKTNYIRFIVIVSMTYWNSQQNSLNDTFNTLLANRSLRMFLPWFKSPYFPIEFNLGKDSQRVVNSDMPPIRTSMFVDIYNYVYIWTYIHIIYNMIYTYNFPVYIYIYVTYIRFISCITYIYIYTYYMYNIYIYI